MYPLTFRWCRQIAIPCKTDFKKKKVLTDLVFGSAFGSMDVLRSFVTPSRFVNAILNCPFPYLFCIKEFTHPHH